MATAIMVCGVVVVVRAVAAARAEARMSGRVASIVAAAVDVGRARRGIRVSRARCRGQLQSRGLPRARDLGFGQSGD